MHASLSHIALIEALATRMGPYMPLQFNIAETNDRTWLGVARHRLCDA